MESIYFKPIGLKLCVHVDSPVPIELIGSCGKIHAPDATPLSRPLKPQNEFLCLSKCRLEFRSCQIPCGVH